jgi:hypothetical protein
MYCLSALDTVLTDMKAPIESGISIKAALKILRS